jgi:hypothetical protein
MGGVWIVYADIGVEVREEDDGGQLNPIYDQKKRKRKHWSSDRRIKENRSTYRQTNPPIGCAPHGVGHGDQPPRRWHRSELDQELAADTT